MANTLLPHRADARAAAVERLESGVSLASQPRVNCDEPQKKAMQVMLAKLRGTLDEFEEAYFDD